MIDSRKITIKQNIFNQSMKVIYFIEAITDLKKLREMRFGSDEYLKVEEDI